jgi:hypothetical protein
MRLRSFAAFMVVVGVALGSELSAATIYVDGTTGDDSNDGSSATFVSTGIGPKKTIQAGINAAGVSDTVSVASGSYAETPSINGTQSFTLMGSDSVNRPVLSTGLLLGSSGNLSLTLQNLDIEGTANGSAVVSNGGTITGLTLDNVKIDGLSVADRYGFTGGQIGGDVELKNSQFENIVSGTTGAWAAFDTRSGAGGNTGSNITSGLLYNCTISNCQGHIIFRQDQSITPYPRIVITSNTVESIGTSTNSFGGIIKVFRAGETVFTNNVIKDVGTSGFNPAGESAYGAGFMPRQVSSLYCVGNTFENCNQGIAIEPGKPVPPGEIADNLFKNNVYGLYVPNNATTPFGSLKIVNNQFISNTSASIRNGTAGDTLTATSNWWGSTGGPSGGNGTIGNVITDPWTGKSGYPEDDAIVPPPSSPAVSLSVTTDTATCDIAIAPSAVTFNGSEAFSTYFAPGLSQASTGFTSPGAIARTLYFNSNQANGTFIATIKAGYNDPADITGFVETEMILGTWNARNSDWELAVNSNTSGTPTWMGDSSPASPTAANLGKYGVDATQNVVWAVVDHCSQYAIGSATGTSAVPVSVSSFHVE